MKKKICILIRVYNRVEDLDYCVNIIRDTWKLNDYYIIVVSNGQKDGYIVSEDCKSKIDKLVDLTNNVGHFQGNSQLLLEGLAYIPDDCEYTIILEADTWIYKDDITNKYIKKLDEENAVWASAQFFRYILNLATDFAIVKTSFIKTHPEIFTFSGTPEYYVANYLKSKNLKFVYITENMPVSLPRYIKRYPYAPTGRFFTFVKGKMVTHHIELLKDGMDEKKFYFNLAADTDYFKLSKPKLYKWVQFKIRIFIALSYLIPYKSWLIKEKSYSFNDSHVKI